MRKRPKHKGGILYWLQLLTVIGLIASIFLVSGFLLWAATIKIPDFSLFETRKVSQSTKIYDRTGTILLYDVHKDIRRTIVPFEEISIFIKNASVAIEDEQFYQHIGIEPKAILRAVLVNLHLRAGYPGQGGSTITQQVIKNALLTNERTITRKITEWILAIKLEREMTKEQILTLYLNEAPYGGNIYGVEEASMSFFGKHASDITLAEATYLAALPQSPTRYSPYGNNISLLEDRKNVVLQKMKNLGSISSEEYDAAMAEQVHFIPQQEQGIKAPHFVMLVKEKLAEMYGEESLNEDGLRVITTIDMDLQTKAEAIVSKYAADNEKKFNASNAALVAIDPKTGQILALVGSRDYFDIAHEGNFNVALAKRQPGSAFKPFVYGAGFEAGYTPDTVLFDVPTQFSTRCDADGNPLYGLDKSVCYMPGNYDHVYRGPMSIRDALSQSVNVPAVKMLYLVGLDHAIDFAKRLGITSLVNKERYGLTLVLGGGEVSLLDITSAYGVFANDGKRLPYTSIISVEDTNKNIEFSYATTSTQVIDPEIARKMSDVLSDNKARTPAFGAESYLNFPDHAVAVKTGTTNDYRDAWIIGYTPSLVVGAWAGNNDNSSMEKKVAGFIIAPLWNAFFSEAFKTYSSEPFPAPQPISPTLKPALRGLWYGGDIYKVDKISGMFATEFTPVESIEERVIPNPHDILYWVNKNDPAGPAPTNPYEDSQFLLWEIPAQHWIAQNGIPSNAWSSMPSGFDSIHKPEFAPIISIIDPNTLSSAYKRDQKVIINTQITSTYTISRVDFNINGSFLGTVSSLPYSFAFIPENLPSIRDNNELRVVAYDILGNKSEQIVQFAVTP
ncbi:MAG: Penicillin-binding protein, 1A family [Parcubacteria group bacterium GW2011_GWA2_47_7]|nr:MAG: Penicillin-binding protein, 1A family [Parcubacteria group bacterium GW2011_GWA2_47_7]